MGQNNSAFEKIENNMSNDFICSAFNGDNEALNTYMISGVPINTTGFLNSERIYCHQEQYSALISAIKGGHVSTALLLLNKDGIHVNYKTKISGINGLMLACGESTLNDPDLEDLLSLFIDKGINIDEKDIENGWSSLSYAASSNNSVAAEFLIKHGANINTIDNFNQSALHIACYKDNLDVVKILIESGMNTDILDREGNTAFDISESDEIKDYLLIKENNTQLPGEIAIP